MIFLAETGEQPLFIYGVKACVPEFLGQCFSEDTIFRTAVSPATSTDSDAQKILNINSYWPSPGRGFSCILSTATQVNNHAPCTRDTLLLRGHRAAVPEGVLYTHMQSHSQHQPEANCKCLLQVRPPVTRVRGSHQPDPAKKVLLALKLKSPEVPLHEINDAGVHQTTTETITSCQKDEIFDSRYLSNLLSGLQLEEKSTSESERDLRSQFNFFSSSRK